MKRSMFRITCFLIGLSVVLAVSNVVLKVKNYDTDYVRNLYAQDRNTVDVLVLGDSHSYMAIYPHELWAHHGYAAYCYGGSGQAIWMTYHFLKEALKTQRPSLIILDAHDVTNTVPESSDRNVVCSTYGMKWSANKVDAILASVPYGERAEYLQEFPAYHDRYAELTVNDFRPYRAKPGWKGALITSVIQPVEAPDIDTVTEPVPLLEKAEMYYRKIIELARDERIPLLVTVVPYALTAEEQGKFLRAAEIAAEYDVPFLNYNELYAETGLDFTADLCDSEHLNRHGAVKVTRHLGAYLAEQYDLPDRRADAVYASWHADAALILRHMFQENLRYEADYKSLMCMFTADPSYAMIVSLNGQSSLSDEPLAGVFREAGVSVDDSWRVFAIRGGEVLRAFTAGGTGDLAIEDALLYMESREDETTPGQFHGIIRLDGTDLPQTGPVEDGMDVIVYDVTEGEILMSFHTWKENGYTGFERTDGRVEPAP